MLKGADIDVGTNTTYEFQPNKSHISPTFMSETEQLWFGGLWIEVSHCIRWFTVSYQI